MFKNLLIFISVISLAKSIEAQGFFDSVNNVQIINLNESYDRKEFKPVTLTLDNKYRFLFKYNNAGEIIEELKQIYTEDKWENKSKKVFSYNEAGRVISIIKDSVVEDKLYPELEIIYTYNDKGELLSVSQENWTGSDALFKKVLFIYTDQGQLASQYTYDSCNETKQKEYETEYTYNGLNNIERVSKYLIQNEDTSNYSNVVLLYNKNDQLTNFANYQSYEGRFKKIYEIINVYDESGNLVSDSLLITRPWNSRIGKYAYDNENRITSVSEIELYDSIVCATTKSFYTYDVDHKTFYSIWNSGWDENELIPHFIYHSKTLNEYDNKNRIVKETNEYFHEDSLLQSEIKEYSYSEKLIQVNIRKYESGKFNSTSKYYHFMDEENLTPWKLETINEKEPKTVNNDKKLYFYDDKMNCIGGYSKILFDSNWLPKSDAFNLPGLLNMSEYAQSVFNFSVEYDSIHCMQTGKPLYNNYFVQGNYPIIFSYGSSIEFNLPKDGITEVELLELDGKVFSTVYRGELKAGYYKLVFSTKNSLFHDLYFRVKSGNYISDKYKFKT